MKEKELVIKYREDWYVVSYEIKGRRYWGAGSTKEKA